MKIESNIAPPPLAGRAKYPWKALAIGESFFVLREVSTVTNIRVLACTRGKQYGKKFSVRVEFGGCRVWRVA